MRIADEFAEVKISSSSTEAPYEGTSILRLALPAWRSNAVLSEQRASVEIYRRVEAAPQRALIGGYRRPIEGGDLLLQIPTSGELLLAPRGSAADSPRRGLIAGLPDEFAQAVVTGLTNWSTVSGEVVITSAAYSAEQSSFQAFRIAAQILSMVLHRTPVQDSDREEQIRMLLRTTSRW